MAEARCGLGADWLALRGKEFVAPVQSSYNAATPERQTVPKCSCSPCPSFLGFSLRRTATKMWNSNGRRAGEEAGSRARVSGVGESRVGGRVAARGPRPDGWHGAGGLSWPGRWGQRSPGMELGSAAQTLTSAVHLQADSKASAAPPMAERAATRSPPVASGRPRRRRRRRSRYVD